MTYDRLSIKLGLAEPSKNKHYKIPARSKKRVKEQKEYVKKVKKAANDNNLCEVKSPVCTYYMQGFNHIQKRTPKNFLKEENLERSCNACNLFCETNPEWAKENGHFISKFIPIKKE